MASIFNLFAERKPAPEIQQERPAPRSAAKPATVPGQIAYDAGLVPELQQDHLQLVANFKELLPLLKSGESKAFRLRLAAFKTAFQGHIIKENVRFYVYLEQTLADDDVNVELMRDFRREMNAISRAVVHFCNRYGEASADLPTIRQFELEAGEIAKALLSRIEREERDLYALYR